MFGSVGQDCKRFERDMYKDIQIDNRGNSIGMYVCLFVCV